MKEFDKGIAQQALVLKLTPNCEGALRLKRALSACPAAALLPAARRGQLVAWRQSTSRQGFAIRPLLWLCERAQEGLRHWLTAGRVCGGHFAVVEAQLVFEVSSASERASTRERVPISLSLVFIPFNCIVSFRLVC